MSREAQRLPSHFWSSPIRLTTRIRRHPGLRQFGKTLERGSKELALRLLSRHHKGEVAPQVTPEVFINARRILLVRPNFRIGNALISAPVIESFAQAFPHLEIDYLGTDTTRVLFEQMPIAEFHCLTRDAISRPWLVLSLIRRLRRRRYDVAVHVGGGSLTSALLTWVSGAKVRVGPSADPGDLYDHVYDTQSGHAYDFPAGITQTLGIPFRGRPWFLLSEQERARGASLVASLIAGSRPPIGVFVGGHDAKQLSADFWRDLVAGLDAQAVPYLVFLGPEEAALEPLLAPLIHLPGALCQPRPLREFAAMLSRLRLLITPDSGPMHLAAALDIPVLAMLNIEGSRQFVPRGPDDRALVRPRVEQVLQLLSPTEKAAS